MDSIGEPFASFPDAEQQDPQPARAPKPNVYDDILRREQETGRQLMRESFNASLATDPAAARRASNTARRLGMDPETALRNPDQTERIAAEQAFDAAKLARLSPILARQIRDPMFTQRTSDEWDHLSTWERMQYAAEVGALTSEKGRLGSRLWLGGADEAATRRIAEIDARLQQVPPVEGFLAASSEIVGQAGRTVTEATAAGLAAAGATAIAGQLGPQVALPEELLTVPGAFVAGSVSVMTGRAAQTEGGLFYLEALRKGADPTAARFLAGGVGFANAALELTGAKLWAAPLKKTIGKVVQERIAEDLARPTITKAAANAAKSWAKTVAGEGATEVMQEVNTIIAEGVATGDWEGVPERLADVAVKTAQGMALLSLPGASTQFAHDASRVQAANKNAAAFQRMSEAAAASKLRQESPDDFQDFAEKVTKGTASETVYIDAVRFDEVLRQGGQASQESDSAASPKPLYSELEKVLPGLSERVRAAAARGDDVVLPSAQYYAKLSGTPLDAVLLPHVRFDPDGLSQFEAQEIQDRLKDTEKAVDEQAERIETFDKELRDIERGLADQIAATGRMGKRDAVANAKLVGAFVRTQSTRLGVAPSEFWKAHNVTVRLGQSTDDALAAKKGVQGGFDPLSNTIFLTPNSDSSTFIHEIGHAFGSIYSKLATEKANPVILDDFNAFLKWAGVESIEKWNAMSLDQQRRHHEALATTFEQYVFEGKAPAPGLRRLFDALASFLRAAYRAIRGELNAAHKAEFGVDLPPLSDDIKAVLDRMLASEDAVRATHAVRGAVPAFLTWEEAKAAGMTPEQWTGHMEAQRAADDEAVAHLTRESLGAMRWLSGAKGKLLREMQRATKAERDRMRGAVAAEIQARPAYRAMRWLKTGELVNEDGTHSQGDADVNHKVRTEDVAALGLELPGMTRADGMPADSVAAAFGFESGEQMLRQIAAAEPIEQAIDAEIDARMLREHSDLADPQRREAVIEAALHTDARQRFAATELRTMSKSLEPIRVTVAATKEAARQAIGLRKVSELSPRSFSAAARRASIESQKAAQAGDMPAAIAWKRREMLQSAMFDVAGEVRERVRRDRKEFDKLKQSDKDLAKAHDIDLVHAAQALAAAYKLGPDAGTSQKREQWKAALAAVRANHPSVASRLDPLLAKATKPIDYRDLTVDEFREVAETRAQLWESARNERILDAEGKKVEVQKALGELTAQLDSLKPPAPPDDPSAPSMSPGWFRQRMMDGWNVLAGLRIWGHKARALDGEKDGPFQRYLLAPMQRALTRYRDRKATIFQRLAKTITEAQERSGSLWRARIAAPELGHTFRGKLELLGAVLHAGSQGNLEANLIGRGWAQMRDDVLDTRQWDAFLRRMFDEGVLTEADTKFLATWWNTFAELLPEAQATHKKRFGYEFKQVEHRPVETPFGTLKGGYVPKRASRYEADERMQDRGDLMTAAASDFQYSVGTSKGFTLSRDENYRPPLTHDVGALLGNIDEELRFIFLEPTVADMMKLLRGRVSDTGPRFRDVLAGHDRAVLNGTLLPWLQNTALQRTSVPGRFRAVDDALRFLRSSASLVMLGGNLANAVLQAGGVSNARMYVGGSFLRAAVRTFWWSPVQSFNAMREKSPAMSQRFDQQTIRMQQDAERASKSGIGSTVTGFRQFMARWAFLPQRLFQLTADTTTWHAAYAEAIAGGKAEADAVAHADNVVVLAQGTAGAEGLAAYSVSTPFVQTFTQFGNYSSLVGNQLFGARSKAAAFLWVMMIPAVLETATKTLFRGQDDKDDDDQILDDLGNSLLATTARNLVGTLPVAGPMVNAMAQTDGTRVLESPASSVVREAWRGALELGEFAQDDDVTPAEARAIATLLSLVTGVPIAAPVRTVQQLAR